MITSLYAGDAKSPPDDTYKLRFQAVIDADERLVHRQFFASVSEPEDGTSPFIVEPPQRGNRRGKINWGDAVSKEWPLEDVSLFERRMSANEHFTRWHPDGEWIYRITAVIDLLGGHAS